MKRKRTQCEEREVERMVRDREWEERKRERKSRMTE